MPDGAPIRATKRGGVPLTPAPDLTVSALVGELTGFLTGRGVAEPRHEAREIVAALCDVPRSWPVANPHVVLERAMHDRALVAAERRARGAPLAYAVGRASFRHLTLDVDERVLIPRPETEQLVDLVLDALHGPGGIAVDVGTGSGAIALALASEARFDRVVATDVSLDALAVARENARLLRDVHRPRSRASRQARAKLTRLARDAPSPPCRRTR